MDLKDYILLAKKKHIFKIRTLFELTDEMMDKLELALLKYSPEHIPAPKKTIYHLNPLGFTGVKSGEVWMVDVTLGVNTTANLLEFDLRMALGLGKFDERFKVYGENEPIMNEPMIQEENDPAILTNEKFEEIDQPSFSDYYGDDYNKKFMEKIKEYEKQRKTDSREGEYTPNSPLVK